MNAFRANMSAFRSLAETLRRLSFEPVNADRRDELLTRAVWYDERANQHEDMADDLDERNADKSEDFTDAHN